MHFSRIFYAASALALCLLHAAIVCGQLPRVLSAGSDTEKATTSPPVAELETERSNVAERLRVAQRQLESAQSEGGEKTASNEELARDVESLKSLDSVLAQHQSAKDHGQELERTKAEIQEQLKTLREGGLQESAPYSFLMLDQLRDELVAEKSKLDAMSAAVGLATDALELATTSFEEKERNRRQAKEAADTNTDETKKSELATKLSLTESESKIADDVVKLRQSELANEKLAEEIQKLRVELLEEKHSRVAAQTIFTSAALQEAIAEIENQEFEVKQSIDSAQVNLEYSESRWAEAREKLETSTEDREIKAEVVEARRLARQKWQQQIALLNRRVQRLSDMRAAWNWRYQIANRQPAPDEMSEWEKTTKALVEQLKRESLVQGQRIDGLRQDRATLDKKADAIKEGVAEQVSAVRQQQQYLVELIQFAEVELVSIESSRRIHEKLLAEIQSDRLTISASEWFAGAWNQFAAVWNFELTSIDDRPITVRKIVIGVVLFLIGIIVSKLISRFVASRMLPHVRNNKDLRAAVQSLVFYVLLITVALFSLRIINVPLTAFTMLGGAAAIGIGFGSQALVNNFLSGLIIMAERPARLGDRVLYAGYDGHVEEVGFRCIKIRTLTGHLVSIPNANIINEPLENIGRRPSIRRLFNVTITYDTPREKVEQAVQIIRDILDEDGIRERIHNYINGDEQPPRAYFNDYNADSLNILVIYWFGPPVYWEYLEHAQNVNLRIFEEFEKAGIDFAFPTQTLHLAGDPNRKLTVEMLGDS